jgi:hypothetical protein
MLLIALAGVLGVVLAIGVAVGVVLVATGQRDDEQ